MTEPRPHEPEQLAGAMYIIVGRGTEGGAASYRLSVAGVTDTHWGEASHVKANSGYSIGAIQVDLGQRGTWALGSIDGRDVPGQMTYVDAIIDQAGNYARNHQLAFPDDRTQLRADLLTHGDGTQGRSTLSFIDADTRSAINAWAGSDDGKRWIHTNIDYPQISHATTTAVQMVDRYGAHIADDRRIETVAILAKTANQFPTQLTRFQSVLENGGTYQDVLDTALQIKSRASYYAGPEAAQIAERYKVARSSPTESDAILRAEDRVASRDYSPAHESSDPDIGSALSAIGRANRPRPLTQPGELRTGSHGENVSSLQSQLSELGLTDANDRPLIVDGNFGRNTRAALERFQDQQGIPVSGIADPRTLDALRHEIGEARQASVQSLSDSHHPGVSMYQQALTGVQSIDTSMGRAHDQASCNLAGSLAVAACSAGFTRIDHVVMSDDGARAYAVQGDLNSPFKRYTDVDVSHSIHNTLEQSGNQFLQASQRSEQQVRSEQASRDQELTQGLQASPHQQAIIR